MQFTIHTEKAVVRLVPIPQNGFRLGTPPYFLEPMSEEDLAAWEGE